MVGCSVRTIQGFGRGQAATGAASRAERAMKAVVTVAVTALLGLVDLGSPMLSLQNHRQDG